MLRMFRLLSISAAVAVLTMMFLASCSSEYDKHYDKAKLLKDEERYEEAIAEYELAAKADPSRAKPWYRIAQVYKNLGKHKDAAASLEKGIAAEPDHTDSYAELVKAYRRDNQLDKAEETAKKALNVPAVKRDAEVTAEIEAEIAEIENARKNPPAVTTGTVSVEPTTGTVAPVAPTAPAAAETTSTGAGVPPAQPNTASAGKVEDIKESK
jgi:tetratricopeptide (TPR) repeat protein